MFSHKRQEVYKCNISKVQFWRSYPKSISRGDCVYKQQSANFNYVNLNHKKSNSEMPVEQNMIFERLMWATNQREVYVAFEAVP